MMGFGFGRRIELRQVVPLGGEEHLVVDLLLVV